MTRPLVAHINLEALRHNYLLVSKLAASAPVLAVIKANAYGHGAIPVAQALQDLAPGFAMACMEEALEVRQAGMQQPIVLLEGFFCARELDAIFQHRLEPVVHSWWQVEALESFLQNNQTWLQGNLRMWLKLDSGMHRLGFSAAELPKAYARLRSLAGVGEIVLTSHLACADEPDHPKNAAQLATFTQLQQELQCSVSLANSPFSLNAASPQLFAHAPQQYLRPGILLYGVSPFGFAHAQAEQLQPVMTLTSQLISVKEIAAGQSIGYGGRWVAKQPTRIGVVACGYGDGYSRHAVDGTPVLVDGHKCQVVGRVSMDMLTVDLTACPQAKVGSEVVLWGAGLDLNEVAKFCDTISYTLVTGLMPRVKRVYTGLAG